LQNPDSLSIPEYRCNFLGYVLQISLRGKVSEN
jgi:hypothetical protein